MRWRKYWIHEYIERNLNIWYAGSAIRTHHGNPPNTIRKPPPLPFTTNGTPQNLGHGTMRKDRRCRLTEVRILKGRILSRICCVMVGICWIMVLDCYMVFLGV